MIYLLLLFCYYMVNEFSADGNGPDIRSLYDYITCLVLTNIVIFAETSYLLSSDDWCVGSHRHYNCANLLTKILVTSFIDFYDGIDMTALC